MTPSHRIICADAVEGLRQLADGSVQCIVTSPPYWGLRSYLPKDHPLKPFEIGAEPTPEAYVAKLVAVFREARRVLRDDGVVWVNLGDSFNGSYHGGGIRTAPGLKPKDLVGIPWRVAFALQADGWWLRRDIIWAKGCSGEYRGGGVMPESVRDRCTSAHEYVFVLAKEGASPTYWTHRDGMGSRSSPPPDYRYVHATGREAAEEPENWRTSIVTCPACGGTGWRELWQEAAGLVAERVPLGRVACDCARGMDEVSEDQAAEDDGHGDQRRQPRRGQVWEWRRVNLWRGHPYYYDTEAVAEPGNSDPHAPGWTSAVSTRNDRSPENESNQRAWGAKGTRNRRSVWVINTQSYPGSHYAVFPPALVEPMILAGTSARGCCPTCGAPWERIVERQQLGERDDGGRTHSLAEQRGNRDNPCPERGWEVERRTVGWQPTCDCDAGEPVPCTVLDPFAGSGTVGVVCAGLNRSFVGIDLNPEYCERHAAPRLEAAYGQPVLPLA